MKTYLLSLFIFFTLNVSAGTGNGKITFLLSNHLGWVIFNVENYTDHACESPNRALGYLFIDASNENSQNLAAQLLAAEASGKEITVQGTRQCVTQNRESVDYIYIGNPRL